jgi:hypothetical protein
VDVLIIFCRGGEAYIYLYKLLLPSVIGIL